VTVSAGDIWAEIDAESRLNEDGPGWRSSDELGAAWGLSRRAANERARALVSAGRLVQRVVRRDGRMTNVYKPAGATDAV